jgi:hypothetical protein
MKQFETNGNKKKPVFDIIQRQARGDIRGNNDRQ